MRKVFLAIPLLLLVGGALLFVLRNQPRLVGDSPSSRTGNEQNELLRSLPYATWGAIGERDSLQAGVTIHDEELALRGLNLFNHDEENVAYLADMDGRVLHSWTAPGEGWHHVEINDSGELFVIIQDERLLKLSWDSDLLWSREGRFHHDLALGDNLIYAITRERLDIPFGSGTIPILDEHLSMLTPDGSVTESISMWRLFGDRVESARLERVAEYLSQHASPRQLETYDSLGVLCDVFHVNAVELIHRNVGGVARPGDLLISLRELDTIAVVDPRNEAVIWSWGQGELESQHHPTLLENDRILVFDNRVEGEGSRVLEVDPNLGRVEWVYPSVPSKDFFSALRGASQRLENGNTLITESDRGRVIEVTRDGRIVWEFWNQVQREKRLRRAIYRMVRLDRHPSASLPFSPSSRDRLKENGYVD